MALYEIVKSFILFVTILVICFGSIHVLYSLRHGNTTDSGFKRIIKLLILTGGVTDVFNLVSLLISSAAGGWPMGFGSCEIFGFVSTILTATSCWMITVATIERYFVLLLPSEFTSTFSTRNLQIIVTGIYVLIMMAATGPFYGFGEYTYLRGYLEILVSTNITIPFTPHINPKHLKLETVHQLFSHLKRSSYAAPGQDLLSAIAHHLQTNYDVIVNKAKWLPHGIVFYIRALNIDSLEQFMQHYRDKMFVHNVTGITLIDDVAMSLNITEAEVTAYVVPDDYTMYRQMYMPIQGLGLCSADMTSSHHHASVWAGFYVLITFVLPYLIIMIGLCLIYMRNLRHLTYSGKQITERDIHYTNNICTIAMATCAITLFYFVILLSSVDGIMIDSDVMFWSTYIASTKSLVFIVTFKVEECNCCCTCGCSFPSSLCCLRGKGSLNYEMSEYEFSRTLVHDGSSKGTNPLMTNL